MGASLKRAPLSRRVPRASRRVAGRTAAAETPLAVRTSGVSIDAAFRDEIHERLGWKLGKFAPHIERVSVRFEDLNGPRGGKDTECRMKVVIAGRPSVVVAERAGDAKEAFHRADDSVERAVRRALGRVQQRRQLRRVTLPREAPIAAAGNKRGAAAAPPRTSTAVRNYKKRTRKAAVALEGSMQERPSRKSTRGSVNRTKHANKLGRRVRRRLASPKGRRARSR
jgi:ribosome-associated translation inhibitor RaiA